MLATLTEIEHEKQRYETVGDWEVGGDPPRFTITVSKMPNPDHMFLVQLHEMIEVWLCHRRGIPQEVVDRFDMEYEAQRPEGDDSEPGAQPNAPYHREHWFATKMERQMAEELGVNWEEYEATINSL